MSSPLQSEENSLFKPSFLSQNLTPEEADIAHKMYLNQVIKVNSIDERGGYILPALAFKVISGSACIVYGLGWLFSSNPAMVEKNVREEYPYEEVEGRSVTYKSGGGQSSTYVIRDPADYENMMRNIYQIHNDNSSLLGGIAATSCSFAITIPF